MDVQRYLGRLDAVKRKISDEDVESNLNVLGDNVMGLYEASEEQDFVNVLRLASGVGERCEKLESFLDGDDWNMLCSEGVDDVFEQVASGLSKKG